MITAIHSYIDALPIPLRQIWERIFYVNITEGHTLPPATMETWLSAHFGEREAVRKQTIVTITNRLTLESALINPLRGRRPMTGVGDDVALEQQIANVLAQHDVFRDPIRDTTADLFGRIQGRFCISASNVAKYEGWHGVIIFDEPHPLRFDLPRLQDYLDVALRWIAAAHTYDPEAIFPIVTWNCLPKSGASIMHGHLQVALAKQMHYARIEAWWRAATHYQRLSNASYYDDLFAIHQALDLALPYDNTLKIFAHLTPLRNNEVVIFADTPDPVAPSDPSHGAFGQGDAKYQEQATKIYEQLHTLGAGPRLAAAIHETLRRLFNRQGTRAFNLAIILPPLITQSNAHSPFQDDRRSPMPVIVRVADRGNALAASSDWGAMELFAANCITVDPFHVARALC